MQTFISQIRKLKLSNGNHINAIEKKLKRQKALQSQLNLMYGNPIRFSTKIEILEAELTKAGI